MIFSNYSSEKFVTPIYEKVTQKLLSLVEDEETKRKMTGILYDGGFDDFSVNGFSYMEKPVLYKNNVGIESKRRLNMAYLLLKNPHMIEVIQKSKGCFFHGTNANALASILKYGINSMNTSIENDINITTGENLLKPGGRRVFVSLTDCLDIALSYANKGINDNNSTNSLLNFGVVIGTSLDNIEGLNVFAPNTDLSSEIGVVGNLPLEHIKFLAVPNDKVEFVKKMVGEKNIEVVSMDISDRFFESTYVDKIGILEQNGKSKEEQIPLNPTYYQDEVRSLVKGRKNSKIKEIFDKLKAKMHIHSKTDKSITGRE